MKIAFTGPSGSGKTTLVKWLSEEYKLPWLNGSSGEIKNVRDIGNLEEMGLVQGKGHKEVIVSGHNHPEAAIANQQRILERRTGMMTKQTDFVTDRSQIDNWVYYWMQCSMHVTDEDARVFRKKCEAGLGNLTHVIYIPTMISPIEDNGSRIASFHYQKMVSVIFDAAIKFWDFGNMTNLLMITEKDLDKRKQQIIEFITRK